MGVVRETLFGKIDLDTLTAMLVLGIDPTRQAVRQISGSASAEALRDPRTLCLEVGGTGREKENDFDHHGPSMGTGSSLSACAQALRRLARLVDYVDELDRGVRRAEEIVGGGFPSLAQLVSGMLLVERDPERRVACGLEILRAVVQSGLDPYGSMEPLLEHVPGAIRWAEQKRLHDRAFEQVCADAQWHTTASGATLAVVVASWIGAPGALYGRGATFVVALNPAMEAADGKTVRKFTVAGHRQLVTALLEPLQAREPGWGGPQHGSIIGSPRDASSGLGLEEVVALAIARL